MSSEIETAIEGLERQVQAKEIELHRLKEAIGKLKELLGTVDSTKMPREMEFKGLGIADAAKRWLQEVGGGRTTREIAEALLARGLTTNSKNYTATVYAVLAAQKNFKRTKDNSWVVED